MGIRLVVPLGLVVATAACGARGSPRPPLRIVPGTIAAEATRLGGRVYLEFTAPDQDSDGATPGDIERIEVYALTAQPTDERPRESFSDDWLEAATLIAALPVRPPDALPVDPERETPPALVADVTDRNRAAGDPVAVFEVGQGEAVTVVEWLTPETLLPVTVGDPDDEDEEEEEDETDRVAPMPFVPPPFPDPAIRSYVAFGISSRGRMADPSALVDVPLVAPPHPPAPPAVSYTEESVELVWEEPPTFRLPVQAEEVEPPILESTPILEGPRPSEYVVYDLVASGDPDVERPARLGEPRRDAERTDDDVERPARLGEPRRDAERTDDVERPARLGEPIRDAEHTDDDVEFGATRCYAVRVLDYAGELEILGDASPATCVVLTDTFAPEAPTGLIALADTNAISLVWDENGEEDVAGYVILRGTAPDATLQPLTVEPLAETAYQDTDVTSGERYIYQVRALDTATPPNASPPSEPVTETAR